MLGYKQITLWSHDLNGTATKRLTTQLQYKPSKNDYLICDLSRPGKTD